MLDTDYKIYYLYDTNSYKAVCVFEIGGKKMVDDIPEACFVIRKKGEKKICQEGVNVLVFSTQEKAGNFLEKSRFSKDGYVALVERKVIVLAYKEALLDYTVDEPGRRISLK